VAPIQLNVVQLKPDTGGDPGGLGGADVVSQNLKQQI